MSHLFRLIVLDNARQSSSGGASGNYEGEDEVQWPDTKDFLPVNSAVPKSDINIAKVGVYFQVHNMSVSRGSKVQKSGFAMFKDGFMSSCSYKSEGATVFFRAAVFAEMKKDMIYLVECRVSDREIEYTYCECTAGRGPHAICKHVAVLLYNLERFEQSGEWILARSCTDRAQSWPCQPKKRKLDPNIPLTPCDVLEMANAPLLQDPRPAKYRCIRKDEKRRHVEMLLINYTSEKKELLHISEICGGKANVEALCDDHNYLAKPLVETWVESRTTVTEAGAGVIESSTRLQHKSAAWKAERQLRLTASSAHRVCNVKKNKQVYAESLFRGTSLEHVAAVRWGRANESAALREYEAVTGHKVDPSGLRVSVEKPFLAASPDGVCADRLVEVKCPYRKEVRESADIKSSGYLPLVMDENRAVRLRENHPYYYQVQLQLYVTKYQLCDFVVYTPSDMCIVTVDRDDAFIEDMVAKMSAFYEEFYKPVVAKMLFGVTPVKRSIHQ